MAQLEPIEIVHRLSVAIARAEDLSQIYELLLDQVVEILKVEKASIMIFDPDIQGLRIVAARGMPKEVMEKSVIRVGEGISGKVFASDKPLLIDDIRVELAGPQRDRYRTYSLMSAPVTCFPMKMGEETLGVINVTDRADAKPFTAEDLKLLTTISNQAAAYLHICQLLAKLQHGERLRQQLEIARQLQYRLVPHVPPSIDGLDVSGQLVTAERVGGDYYDCYLSKPSRPAFIIADVSGHSIGAAMIMAAFRAAVRAQQDSDYSPSTLAKRVNQILFEDLYQAEQFISMVYVQYLKSRQLIHFTNAGHPPPLIWKEAEQKFEYMSTDDPLLGIAANDLFHEKAHVVSSGDVVVMYTDGIVEAADADGKLFGIERLCSVVESVIDRSAHDIVDHVISEVSAFIEPEKARDDITLLVLKVK